MAKAKSILPPVRLQTKTAYSNVIKDIDRRELRSGSVQANWNNYVVMAKGLLAVAEVSRMAVAEIATRATLIRLGGDRHSLNWRQSKSKLSLTAFSKEIGTKPSTLWLWIKIKERVYDQLSEKQKQNFKHDDAEKAFKLMGSKSEPDPEKARELYQALSNRTREQRLADKAVLHLMSARKAFSTVKRYMNESQVSAAKLCVLEILKEIETFNEVYDNCRIPASPHPRIPASPPSQLDN